MINAERFFTKHTSLLVILQRESETRFEGYRDMADAVSAVLGNDELTSEAIARLVDRVFIKPDKSFEIRLKYADEFAEVGG